MPDDLSSKLESAEVEHALEKLRAGVEIRKEITELYRKYNEHVDMFLAHTGQSFSRGVMKRVVDAHYYLGGGWPNASSKGRMEAFLDTFTNFILTMEFLGYGDMVKDHLRLSGVTIKIDKKFLIEDRELEEFEKERLVDKNPDLEGVNTAKELGRSVVEECKELQGEICGLADQVNKGIRPEVNRVLGTQNVDFARLVDTAKATGKRRKKRGEAFVKMVDGLNIGLKALIDEKEVK
jgi:hypothetical protein